MGEIGDARRISHIGAKSEDHEHVARGLFRRLAGSEGIVRQALEPGRQHAERAVSVEIPFDGPDPPGIGAERIFLAAL